MIYYLVNAGNTHTVTRDKSLHLGVQPFSPLEKLFEVVPYHLLFEQKQLRPGTYLFSDLECMNASEFRNAKRLWQVMSQQSKAIRMLNTPGRTLMRFDLLRKLYDAGINSFNIYRLNESHSVKRFPVFIRHADDHGGNISPLIHNLNDLEQFVSRLESSGQAGDNKVIIEFADTSEAGVHKKYSAYVIGNQIIPRHILWETQWMVKTTDLPNQQLIDAWLEEERSYVENNPHETALREVAQLADVQYGRIDYGVLDDRPQVWEINTNPMLFSLETSIVPLRESVTERFFERFNAVMEKMAYCPQDETPVTNPFATKIRNRRRINWALDLCLKPLGLTSRRQELVRGLSHRLSANPVGVGTETDSRRDFTTLSKKES